MPKIYLPEFKRDAVMVVRRRETTMEQSPRISGISTSSVKRWMQQADIDDGVVDGQNITEQQDVVRLRRENRRLQQEVEVCCVRRRTLPRTPPK